MNIDIRATNIDLTPAACRVWERRTLFALKRFAPRVRVVVIVLTDVNGPRGGNDTECLVRITGARWQSYDVRNRAELQGAGRASNR